MPIVRETPWGAVVTDSPCDVCKSKQFPTALICTQHADFYLCAECATKVAADLLGTDNDACEQCGSTVNLRSLR